MTRPIVFVALLAGIACSSGTEAGDASISTVNLRGSVRDTANQPVPLAFVGWEAWPPPTPGLSWSSVTVADSQGRFSIPLDSIGVAMLDSVLLFYPHLSCSPYRGDSLVLRDIPVASGKVTTIDDIELRPAMNAPAMLATGQYCGDASYQWEENQYSGLELGLWIDEITDSVRGRWRLVFQESRGDDYGHFSGAVEGDSLMLELRLDQPWEACQSYTLALPVTGADILGTGRYRSDGCPAAPVGIRLSRSHEMDWPFH